MWQWAACLPCINEFFFPFNENVYLIKCILWNIDPKMPTKRKNMQGKLYLFLNSPNAPPTGKWGEVGKEQSCSNSVTAEWEGKGKKVKAKHLRGIDSQALKVSCLSFKYIPLQYVKWYICFIFTTRHILSTNNILETLLACWVIKMYKTSFITYRAQTNQKRQI